MYSSLNAQARQIFCGNLMLIGCLVFYLAWWLVAFRPNDPIKGFKSGWLLIPAFLFGVAGAMNIIQGCIRVNADDLLLQYVPIAIGGVVVYLLLLTVTTLFFGRMVTSELIIMTGWATLMFAELSALYGTGRFGLPVTLILLILVVLALAISVVCYVLFYNLDISKAYIDGTVPLVLGLIMMAVISLAELLF